MKLICYCCLVTSLLLASRAGAQAAPELRLGDLEMTVIQSGTPTLTYAYRGVPFKPYVRAWVTPSGVNPLRDAPHDHLHHHALMFAIIADDIDFWAETPTCGKQVHRGWSDVRVVSENGISRAAFTERLEWVPAKDLPVAVVEYRTVETLTAEDIDASLLTWTSRIELPPGKAAATLTGHHYHGLGMRFVEAMDKGGAFRFGAPGEGEVVRGDERLTPGPWCAYTARIDGKPVTAAMFDHPGNPRPVLWFTMQTPFSYLSATVNLWREALEVTRESPVTFRYGVAIWDGETPTERIEAIYQRWRALASFSEGEGY
ncbi:MAG TPA: PmoA family protein [Candidatus Hydrogenedentes bacterium]|nr:PmoA family protein [Candidatus Hydrogenedentota bacterium]